jgi:hypothetical protein
MKNKILQYVGVGVVGFIILIISVVSISSFDSSRPPSVSAPVVTAIGTTTMPTTTKVASIVLAPSVKVATSTYGVRFKTSGCLGDQALPDSACTPGAIFPVIATQVCVSGYTATVRDVPDSLKKQVFQEYGISYDLHSNYEVDHLISLELGGSNDIANLFPESYIIDNGARTKDKLENYLHRQVCSGAMTLVEAQYEISHDWIKYFDQAGLSKAQLSIPTVQTPTQTTQAPSTDSSAPAVKKSSSGICHAQGTTYYDRTQSYTSYDSMSACIASGGKQPAN